jgi:serine/threonine-protein kinase HipA
VAAWFENLLPDSTLIRRRIRERVGARSTAAFDLLAEIGRDCAGAVQFVPAGLAPGDVRRIDAEPLDEAAVARELRAVTAPAAPGRRDDHGFRISLAGAQEKTALLRHQDRWCRPLGATPTTHLFKLPIGRVGNMQADFATSVENEWLCSEIVRAFGLDIARAHVATFEDQKVLVVERFDRRLSADGRWWLRLPQEDFCQANGLRPDARYEADGGPGVPALMGLLANSEAADRDRDAFFRAQLVFWLLAATDGHAKNFSLFLGPRGAFRMTPLYDVLSVYPVLGRGRNQLDPRDAKLAMAVVGRNRHYA